jgi:hypothetical protein
VSTNIETLPYSSPLNGPGPHSQNWPVARSHISGAVKKIFDLNISGPLRIWHFSTADLIDELMDEEGANLHQLVCSCLSSRSEFPSRHTCRGRLLDQQAYPLAPPLHSAHSGWQPDDRQAFYLHPAQILWAVGSHTQPISWAFRLLFSPMRF